jgi:hypothetical protein
VALKLVTACWRPEIGKNTGGCDRGVHGCNSSRIILLRVPWLLPHSNKLRRGATEVTRASTATLVVRPHRNSYRHGDKLQSAIKSIPPWDLLPSRGYPLRAKHESRRPAQIQTRGSPAASLLSWQSDRDTVPSRILFSWSDRALLRAICAKFCVVTRPTLYIKIIVQQARFKFPTEVLVKQPLNQALQVPKLILHTINQSFRLEADWQPNFGPCFLSTLHNNNA